MFTFDNGFIYAGSGLHNTGMLFLNVKRFNEKNGLFIIYNIM